MQNQPKEKSSKRDHIFDLFIVAVLSVAVFCCIYGIRIIDPLCTDWTMSADDLTQHYLGWKGFRTGSWHFPPGMTDSLAYPNLTSVIFTDSIPLFAVLFKLFAPVLPGSFQYLGLWGLLSFILQGVIAANIVSRYTSRRICVILSGVFFVFAPVLLYRMFMHTALGGQWIVLLGLDLLFDRDLPQKQPRQLAGRVVMLGLISSSVHMYFVLMNGIILFGACIYDCLSCRRIRRSLLIMTGYAAVCGMTIALLGGFNSGFVSYDLGLGYHSFNLNGMLNPLGWSSLFRDRALAVEGQIDGFAYLGAGCFLLMIAAAVSLFLPENRTALSADRARIIAVFAVSLIFIAFSASHVVTFGSHTLFYYDLPEKIIRLWSVFRASGRFIWPVVYMIMIISCIGAGKIPSGRIAAVVLCLALVLQIYDIHTPIAEKHSRFAYRQPSEVSDGDPLFWEPVCTLNRIKHIVLKPDMEKPVKYMIADIALDHGITVSDFYFARSSHDLAKRTWKQTLADPPEDTIFVFAGDETPKYDLWYYNADGLILGSVNELAGVDEGYLKR